MDGGQPANPGRERARRAMPQALDGLRRIWPLAPLVVFCIIAPTGGVLGSRLAHEAIGVPRVPAIIAGLIVGMGVSILAGLGGFFYFVVPRRGGIPGVGGMSGKERTAVTIGDARAAVDTLDELLTLSFDPAAMSALATAQRAGIRAGVVQCFLDAFELCYRLIERWVKKRRDDEETRYAGRDKVLMLAASDGLIVNVARWSDNSVEYYRAYTSVGWDGEHHPLEQRADRVHAAAPGFIEDARALLDALGPPAPAEEAPGDGPAA